MDGKAEDIDWQIIMLDAKGCEQRRSSSVSVTGLQLHLGMSRHMVGGLYDKAGVCQQELCVGQDGACVQCWTQMHARFSISTAISSMASTRKEITELIGTMMMEQFSSEARLIGTSISHKMMTARSTPT